MYRGKLDSKTTFQFYKILKIRIFQKKNTKINDFAFC